MKRLRFAGLVLMVAIPVLAEPAPASEDHFSTQCVDRHPSEWLEVINRIRTSVGVQPLVEDPGLSDAAWKHARYVVKTDQPGHSEDPTSPWYTEAGANSQSVLATSNSECATDWWALLGLMTAPFHAAHMLNPRLSRTGFGSFREAGGQVEMAAALDVGGVGGMPPNQTFPVLWPGPGTEVWVNDHYGEWPSPLTSCPGYSLPTGLPLLAQLASSPQVTASSFSLRGQELDHCIIDGSNYENPSQEEEDLGRSILTATNSVIVLPRLPLASESTYEASLTVDGTAIAWSFRVDISNVLNVSRSGHGTVGSRSGLVTCRRSCSRSLPAGAKIELVAEALRGWRFAHWSGDCRGRTCSLHMTKDVQTRATFRRLRSNIE